jgi:hypothetical protein
VPPTPEPLGTPRPTPTPRPPAHHIELQRIYGIAGFNDQQNKEPFVPRGVNYFYLVPANGVYENRVLGVSEFDPQRIDQDFGLLQQAGYNTVRIIFDLCRPGPECIVVDGEQGMNPGYLDSLVQVMHLAQEHSLVLILASNDLPQGSKYATLAETGVSRTMAAGRNATLLTTAGLQATRFYWDDLLSGLIELQAPFDVVLGWELLNEGYYQSDAPPFSLDQGRVTTANGSTYALNYPEQQRRMAVDGMRYYIREIRQAILRRDPGALVTMGFFAPVTPHAWRESDPRNILTGPLMQDAALDFFDFHLYPGTTLSQAELVENFALPGYTHKPVLMGETGAYTAIYPTVESAARALQDWIAGSCPYGFDGWLVWGYYRAPDELSDTTWSFTDEDGHLMRSLSPDSQPDACQTTILRGDSLALGKPVTASAEREEYPAAWAVDGSPARWNSGQDAPQWIEIDLGGQYPIGLIRLTIDQWPDGDTLHQVWAAGDDGEMRLLTEFSGWTTSGQVLEWVPPELLSGIRFLRIVTTLSPSWVGWQEIEVIAP